MGSYLKEYLDRVTDREELSVAVYAAVLALEGLREVAYEHRPYAPLPITVDQIDQYRKQMLMPAQQRLLEDEQKNQQQRQAQQERDSDD